MAVVTVTVAVDTVPPVVKVVRAVNVVREEEVVCVYRTFCVVLEEVLVDDADDWTTALVPLIPIQPLKLSLISSAYAGSEV